MNFTLSAPRKTLPVLPRHKTPPRPTEKSRKPNRHFFPAVTIPEPIKRSWISGRHRASRLPATGTFISKGFMLDTLKNADSLGGYFMTDSSTWIEANKSLKHLKDIVSGRSGPDQYLSCALPAGRRHCRTARRCSIH